MSEIPQANEESFFLPGTTGSISEFTGYRNPYRDPARAREYIAADFAGANARPGGMVRQLVYLRTVLTVGARASFFYRAPDGQYRGPEYFISRLLGKIVRRNRLDSAGLMRHQLVAEQEGSVLVRPRFVDDDGLPEEFSGIAVDLETRLRRLRDFEIVTHDRPLLKDDPSEIRTGDPLQIQGAVFAARGNEKSFALAASRFAYFRHISNVDDFNPPPPVHHAIPYVRFYEDVFVQKRVNLSYFAKLLLHFKLDENASGTRLREIIQRVIGTYRAVIGHRGDVRFVEPQGHAARVLAEEQDYLAQHIAGLTGIPAFYLGLLRLMRNRATPKEVLGVIKINFEPIRNDLATEFYPDLLAKAIEQWILGAVCRQEGKGPDEYLDAARRIRPERAGEYRSARARLLTARGCADYDPDNLACMLPPVTVEELDWIRESLAQHAGAGMISPETYVRQAPDLPDDEAGRLQTPRFSTEPAAVDSLSEHP